MQSTRAHNFHGKQSGSTLIVTLIILILVMLLGVTAMNTSDTQAKLTGNLQFENIALNNAETALNTAEQALYNNPSAGVFPQTAASGVTAAYDPLTNTGWQAAGFEVRFVSNDPLPSASVGTACSDPTNPHNYDCVNTFVVTAIGTGARGATKIVQSYYSVPLH